MNRRVVVYDDDKEVFNEPMDCVAISGFEGDNGKVLYWGHPAVLMVALKMIALKIIEEHPPQSVARKDAEVLARMFTVGGFNEHNGGKKE